MLLAFVVLLALASACSNKHELVPAPDAPVISFVADLELRYFPPTTAQPNDTTRVKRTYRSDDAWRLDAFQSDSPEPAQAAAVQGDLLTVANLEDGEYFHTVAYEEYGGMLLQIGRIDSGSIDEFLEEERRQLELQDRGGPYTLRYLDDGVIAGRPVKRAELRSDAKTHYFAIDAEAMFVLAYSVRPAGGGGAGLHASTIQYNPIISDEDLALDLDRLHRIEAPELFFTPVP